MEELDLLTDAITRAREAYTAPVTEPLTAKDVQAGYTSLLDDDGKLKKQVIPSKAPVDGKPKPMLDFAINHLREHPELMQYSGHKLEKMVTDRLVSYATWYKAKRIIQSEV